MDDIFDYDFTMGGGDKTYFGDNTTGNTSWIDNFDWSGALNNLDFGNLDLSGLDLSNINLDKAYIDLGDTGTLFDNLGDLGITEQDLAGIDLNIPYQDLEDVGTLLGSGLQTEYPGYITNPDGSITPYGFDKGYYGEGESHGVDEAGREYWIAPDGSVMYSKYVDEKGYERNPDGTPTGRTIEDIVGPKKVTVPSGRIPTGIDTSGIGGAGINDKSTIDKTKEPPTKQPTDQPKTPFVSKDNAMLIALLGGLLGLLGKGSTPTAPVGYRGGIPTFTAQRLEPGKGMQFTKTAAKGGLMGLAAGGRPARYLRGGTDGMADKIQTDIEGEQPARLSHGEFVLPADIVSALGSGNSEAGADVLYDMMDRVRKHAYGRKKQITPVNKSKVLPA